MVTPQFDRLKAILNGDDSLIGMADEGEHGDLVTCIG